MTDEQLRIRSYLQAQGAKLSPHELVDKVRVAMGQLRASAIAVPAARFNARPAAEEWSANEVMAHVVTAGARFAERITRALDGGPPGTAVADVIERGVPEHTAEQWWSILARAREELFTRVLRADPTEHPERVIEHPFFGPLNWRETVLFLRLHDLDHAGQLQKIADALGAGALTHVMEGAQPMLGVVATIKVKPGMEKDFELVARELVAKVTANEPGCKLYALHHAEAPHTYVFMERYVDQAAVEAHRATDYFKALGRKMGEFMDGRAEVLRLREVE